MRENIQEAMISLLVIAAVCAGVYFVFMITRVPSIEVPAGKRLYHIALMTDKTPYHEAVNKGFMKAIADDTEHFYKVDTFYSEHCDYLVMRHAANHVSLGEYDAVVTVGSRFSQVVVHHLKRRHRDTPMIFIGVAKPVDIGCVQSEEAPGWPVNGVRSADDLLDMQARVLHFLAPHIKSVLIVYDTQTDQGKQQAEFEAMQQYFTAHGVVVRSRMVDQPGTTMSIIRVDLDYVDAMMVLEGSASALDYYGIGRLCDRYKVILCAGNAGDMAEEVASIAFGPEPQYAGQRGYLKMRAILRGEIDPRTTPVERISRARRMVLNLGVCKRQGFEPDPLKIYALDRGKVIGS